MKASSSGEIPDNVEIADKSPEVQHEGEQATTSVIANKYICLDMRCTHALMLIVDACM